jgi:pyruvate,water dikinase
MSWLPLACFHDERIPKLDNLRRAAAAGLRVPVTCWLTAAEVDPGRIARPEGFGAGPLIVRSGSPTEDGRTTSNAGQLLSLMAPGWADFRDVVRRVVEVLPRDAAGRPRGAVFVQPVVEAEEAGVAFFDGFYYERTAARGDAGGRSGEPSRTGKALNVGLTAGQERGDVKRAHLERDEPWSEWLSSVYAVFGPPGGDRRLDVEWARDAAGYVLLQVRPALFPVLRNELLTLANIKETLGDPPSPWTVSGMVEAGRGMHFMRTVDAELDSWEEDMSVELAGRAWINVSVWYRYLDSMGLHRTMFSRLLGGVVPGPADSRVSPGRFLRNGRRFARGFWLAVAAIVRARRILAEMDAVVGQARDLAGLYRAYVHCWEVSIYTAIAIAGTCGFVLKLRQALGISGAARLVTQEMMEEYRRLGGLPDAKAREVGLDAWLARFGHRGPWESDVARPRFSDLREVLLQDLASRKPPPPPPPLTPVGRLWRKLLRPFFLIDERREWFRDEAILRLHRLRLRMLEEGARLVAGGQLDAPDDVFFLHGEDLQGKVPLREAAAKGRARHEAARALSPPITASREAIEAFLARSEARREEVGEQRVFPGIPLGPAVIEGTAHVAEDLVSVLREAGEGGAGLGPTTILVVPMLEPSWAVLFPRVGGVVAEVGGELSHASILLRESGRPAVVNVTGIFRRVRTGDRLRLDGRRGVVELIDP